MALSASEAIGTYNSGREPQRLAMKYAGMRTDAFRFLRGTCHLFYERMTEGRLALDGPRVWICGDLHLENLGTYLGDDGLTYFDVNDFDEAALAPFQWDIMRLATSVLVGAPTIGLTKAAGGSMARLLVETYFEELAAGKPRWLERRTATGPIAELIEKLRKRDGAKFIGKRTETVDGALRLLIDSKRALAVTAEDRRDLTAFFATLAKSTPSLQTLSLLDVARRIAGTGSLGVGRYVLLVEGPGGPDLLDLKAVLPSAVAPFVGADQPPFANEADRVVAVQTLFQANTPSLLSAHIFRGAPYLLKQLQPSADRLDLNALADDKEGFASAIKAMAQLTAWGHLRGTGRYGAATADHLIAAVKADPKAGDKVVEAAAALAQATLADWAEYSAAYDAGAFGKPIKNAQGE